MLDFPRWKIWLIVSSLVIGVMLSVPTFFPERLYNQLPSFMQVKVNLGLDLSGAGRRGFLLAMRSIAGRFGWTVAFRPFRARHASTGWIFSLILKEIFDA